MLRPVESTKKAFRHVIDFGDPNRLPDRYFFGLCPASLWTKAGDGGELKACSGCLSICYAGRDQQKSDWKRHKQVCKVLQKLNKSNPGCHPLSKQPDMQGTFQKTLSAALNRELSQFESDLLVYPRLCSICLDGRQVDTLGQLLVDFKRLVL